MNADNTPEFRSLIVDGVKETFRTGSIGYHLLGLVESTISRAEIAEAERDDLETRLSYLLYRLTDGAMSGTGYAVETMVGEVEATFEKWAQQGSEG